MELYPVAPEDYSLDVTLSTDWYEIHGQYLHWFYSPPSPSALPPEYTIPIRRSGGPITPALVKRLASSSVRIGDGAVNVCTNDGEGCFEALYDWVAGLDRGCAVMLRPVVFPVCLPSFHGSSLHSIWIPSINQFTLVRSLLDTESFIAASLYPTMYLFLASQCCTVIEVFGDL